MVINMYFIYAFLIVTLFVLGYFITMNFHRITSQKISNLGVQWGISSIFLLLLGAIYHLETILYLAVFLFILGFSLSIFAFFKKE